MTPSQSTQITNARDMAEHILRQGHSRERTRAALMQLFPAGAVQEAMEGRDAK